MGSSADATLFFGTVIKHDPDDFDRNEFESWELDIPAGAQLLLAGYDSDGPACLAIASTVKHAWEWQVEPVPAPALLPLATDHERIALLHKWADKLGIAADRRAPIGWYFYATYG